MARTARKRTEDDEQPAGPSPRPMTDDEIAARAARGRSPRPMTDAEVERAAASSRRAQAPRIGLVPVWPHYTYLKTEAEQLLWRVGRIYSLLLAPELRHNGRPHFAVIAAPEWSGSFGPVGSGLSRAGVYITIMRGHLGGRSVRNRRGGPTGDQTVTWRGQAAAYRALVQGPADPGFTGPAEAGVVLPQRTISSILSSTASALRAGPRYMAEVRAGTRRRASTDVDRIGLIPPAVRSRPELGFTWPEFLTALGLSREIEVWNNTIDATGFRVLKAGGTLPPPGKTPPGLATIVTAVPGVPASEAAQAAPAAERQAAREGAEQIERDIAERQERERRGRVRQMGPWLLAGLGLLALAILLTKDGDA